MADQFDIQAWVSSLKTKHPDVEVPQEAVAGWMRQSDYDRNFNTLKQEHADRMAKEDKFHAELKKAESRLLLLKQLEDQFGPAEEWSDALNNAIRFQHPELDQRQARSTQGLDLETVQQMIQSQLGEIRQQVGSELQRVGIGAATMIDFMSEAPDEWRSVFGTKFPKKEFSDFFAQSGTTDPYTAFDLFKAPYLQKKMQEDHAKELEKAKQEGYQSAMSKHGHVEALQSANTTGMFFEVGEVPRIDPASGAAIQTPDTEPSREERRAKVGSAFVRALEQAERMGGNPLTSGQTKNE